MSYFTIRTPYDAKADVEKYIEKLQNGGAMAEGGIPPAVGVEIRSIDAKWALRALRADANNTKLEEVVREERAKLAEQIQEALEHNIMVALTEVGVDPEALKYTAELNRELMKERKKWMELYCIKDEENHRLEREIIRLKGQVLRLSGERGVEVLGEIYNAAAVSLEAKRAEGEQRSINDLESEESEE